jgi:hypothetical protein
MGGGWGIFPLIAKLAPSGSLAATHTHTHTHTHSEYALNRGGEAALRVHHDTVPPYTTIEFEVVACPLWRAFLPCRKRASCA